LAALPLMTAGCGGDGPFLQTEQYVTRAGHEEKTGTACMAVGKGNGMGGGRAPGVPGAAGEGAVDAASDYSFSYDGTGSGVRLLVVDSAGNTLADRSYDSAFIDSGRKDEVKIDVVGESARFVSWGVPQCVETAL
jgi:hypothetical protein